MGPVLSKKHSQTFQFKKHVRLPRGANHPNMGKFSQLLHTSSVYVQFLL